MWDASSEAAEQIAQPASFAGACSFSAERPWTGYLVLNEQPAEKPGLQGSKAVPDEACEGCHGVAAKRELVQGGDLKLVVPLGALGKGAGVVAVGELN
jgi:hypothetical protein